MNVTFPGFTPDAAGLWSLRDGANLTVTSFFVFPAHVLTVMLSSSTVTRSATAQSIAITVSPLGPGQTAVVSAPGLFPPGNVTGNANGTGSYTFVGPLDHAATYTITATRDIYAPGNTVPEIDGSAQLSVVDGAPLVVSVSPPRIFVGVQGHLTVHVTDANGNVLPDGQVTLTRADGGDASSDLGGTIHLNGTGDLGAGGGGDYTFTLTPRTQGAFVAAARSYSSSGSGNFTVAPTPNTVVSIASARGSILAPTSALLRITNATDLGSITLTITMNPRTVHVTDAAPGNVPGEQVTWSFDNATGTATLLVTTSGVPGPAGDFVLANLSLQAEAAPGNVTPMRVTLTETVHSDGSTFDAIGKDGVFHAGLMGDANGDGRVDAQDALAIAEYVVGKNTGIVIETSDVNHDGRVTGVDAMFLRQFLAGARATLE